MRDSLLRQVVYVALIFLLSLRPGWGEETATVTTHDPITFVQGVSKVTRPVGPNEVFSVVAIVGDNVTLADSRGFQATLSRSSLKITDLSPPSGNTNSAPATLEMTNGIPAIPTTSSDSPPVESTVPTTPHTATEGQNPEDAKAIEQLNDAFQVALFTDTNLWSDADTDVARRLKWPQESKTSTDASFRLYALKGGAPVLGAHAYSMALYSRNGHPTYISMVFANKGDISSFLSLDKRKEINPASLATLNDYMQKFGKDLNAAVKSDADTINAQLTAILGTPETHQFGPTSNSRETVHRWDWKGHAILLSSPRDEYAALKIVPSEVADHAGDVANMDRETIKAELAKRVLKSDNGDVVLQEIPMVDQGPKGYCVPATWERYLRYVDVPADMYVLAMLGNSGIGGGTNIYALRAGVNDYVGSYGRRIETANVPLDVAHISKFIDQGLPLMWSCFAMEDIEKEINLHTTQRKKVIDWESYKTNLQADDKTLVPLSLNDLNVLEHGHMRMIIGYNVQSDELAISDSWGESCALRWITVKEAQNITRNDLEYIQW